MFNQEVVQSQCKHNGIELTYIVIHAAYLTTSTNTWVVSRACCRSTEGDFFLFSFIFFVAAKKNKNKLGI